MSEDLTPHPEEAGPSRDRDLSAGAPGDPGGRGGSSLASDPDRAATDAATRGERHDEPPAHPVAHAIREFVIVVALALVLSLAVKTWLMQAFFIPSGSMEDTLVRGDRVVVSKLSPSPFALERGDVVVFDDQAQWLAQPEVVERSGLSGALHDSLVFVGLLPSDSDSHLIKRVIGLPGDKVRCCTADGKVSVNGATITEPYLKPGDAPSADPFEITVPKDKVWVMGDHRSDSSDSRYHDPRGDGSQGAVAIDTVVGRAVAVVWPLPEMTWLGRPSSTFSSVPAPR